MSEVADKPILFSGAMVRAIIDGRKSQTRRLLRNTEYYGCPTGDCPHRYKRECDAAMAGLVDNTGYFVGQRLWVREAWGVNHYEYERASGPNLRRKPPGCEDSHLSYRATEEDPETLNCLRYRPSIHMPRWASRITLTVTDIHLERLKTISESDALAEGIDDAAIKHFGSPIKAFSALWNSLARTEEQAWEADPWVVAITFQHEIRNIDA